MRRAVFFSSQLVMTAAAAATELYPPFPCTPQQTGHTVPLGSSCKLVRIIAMSAVLAAKTGSWSSHLDFLLQRSHQNGYLLFSFCCFVHSSPTPELQNLVHEAASFAALSLDARTCNSLTHGDFKAPEESSMEPILTSTDRCFIIVGCRCLHLLVSPYIKNTTLHLVFALCTQNCQDKKKSTAAGQRAWCDEANSSS
jgi:hypothetical protein